MSALAPCQCTHEWQDTTYGKSIRVHNTTATGSRRCSVCGATK